MLFFHKSPAAAPVEWIIVGLGNPGKQYENTRHNAGYMLLDTLAEQCHVKIDRVKFKGVTATTTLCDKGVLLLKPETYMNLSGQSVQQAMQFYKILPEKTIILLDDISLPVGKLRIRRKGSDGGQNGMKNIIYLTGSDQFPRIKIGIGNKPNPGWDLADWVLSRFTKEEQSLLQETANRGCDALRLLVQDNIQEAMNRYNG